MKDKFRKGRNKTPVIQVESNPQNLCGEVFPLPLCYNHYLKTLGCYKCRSQATLTLLDSGVGLMTTLPTNLSSSDSIPITPDVSV